MHAATEGTLGLMKTDTMLFDGHTVASDPNREKQNVILNFKFHHSSEDPLLLLLERSLHIIIVLLQNETDCGLNQYFSELGESERGVTPIF